MAWQPAEKQDSSAVAGWLQPGRTAAAEDQPELTVPQLVRPVLVVAA